MKKLIKIAFSLILLTSLLWVFTTQGPLASVLKGQLTASGYPNAQLGIIRFTQKPAGLEINDIDLDGSGKNVLGRAWLSFFPLRLTLDGLKFEVNLSQKDTLGDTEQSSIRTLPPFLPSLLLNPAEITVLSKQGAFKFLLEGSVLPDNEARLGFEGKLTADQPELALDAAFSGNVTPAGDLTAKADIKNSAFNLPSVKGQNIAGTIRVYLPKHADGEAEASATIALLDLADIPLENVTLTYKGVGQNQTLALQGSTKDKSASLSANGTALMQENRDLKVDGKLNVTARKLEKIKSSLAGSGTLDFSFSGIQKESGKWENAKGALIADVMDLTIGSALKKANGGFKSNITASPDGNIHAVTTAPVKFSTADFSAEISEVMLDITNSKNDLANFSGNIGKFIKFSGQHNFKNSKGSTNITLPPITFTPQQQPENLIAALKGKAEDVSGSLGADFHLAWKASGLTASSGHILLKDIAAKAHDISAQGINAVLALESLAPLSLKDQTISIARLDAGLPLTEGIAAFSLNEKQLSVADMKWVLAKGSLVADPFSLALEKMDASLTLKAANLDLAELFALAPMDGLTATGNVNGTIPVRVTGDRVFIDKAVLETSIPGAIRYDPKEVPSFLQNPTAGGVIDLQAALKNFQYEQLKMTISGEAGKEQEIILSVKGSNPGFYNGKAVNINLNLGGTIDKVLKSNFGAYKIPNAVQKQIETYEKEHGGL